MYGLFWRKRKKILPLLTGALLFMAGIAAGFVADRFISRGSTLSAYPVREKNEGKYKFIDPLLTFETAESDGGGALSSLKSEIEKTADQHIRNRDLDRASVYVRALNSGRWISVRPEERYNPASLLKVPTMIAFFKLAESEPDILLRRVAYAGNFDDNKTHYFRPAGTIEPGISYSIEELIEAMITYSDNNATRLLDETVHSEALKDIYADLQIPVPDFRRPGEDFLSAKSYSYFFRVLYNATYLRKSFSEAILKILAESDFTRGIRSPIPSDIAVSHKFGERSSYLGDGTLQSRELHDCGVVYDPAGPYFVCIMTKGRAFEHMEKTIQDISAAIFDEVHSPGIR